MFQPMSTETDNRIFYNSAMQGGTLLGLLWIAMYASCIAGFGSPLFTLLFLALNIASPFYAGYLAKSYRRSECNGILPFGKAFTFVFVMYFCASLLSAVAHFVYFQFMDNGFIMQLLMETSRIMEENKAQFGELSTELNKSIEQFLAMGTKGIVFNMFTSNIMNGILLSAIIALFVKRNPQQ